MFSKKPHADLKKSTQKFLDSKKDSSTRLKHLRVVIDHIEGEEALSFFSKHSNFIYYLVCDVINAVEANFKQRDLTFHLVHKAHREELESALFVLEQLLLHLPELLGRGWQQHSLLHTLSKLLHPNNSWKLKKDAIRYFIIWYQILGENAPEEVDALFATIVPGFPSPKSGMGLPNCSNVNKSSVSSIFHDSNPGAATDVQPVLPPQSGEKPLEEPVRFFLDVLLDAMVSQVTRVHWVEKLFRPHKSFLFLLEKFKQYYLPHIFPGWNSHSNLYSPYLDLPNIRRASSCNYNDIDTKEPALSCRVAVIKWVASFTHTTKKDHFSHSFHSSSVTPDTEHSSTPGDLRRVSMSQSPSTISPNVESSNTAFFPDAGDDYIIGSVVREVFYSSRENVSFVIEVYRQAFLLPFSHAQAIRKVISVYKDWIQMNVPETPPFMLEPLDVNESDNSEFRLRLRNDSYLGAVHKDYTLVRAGLQSTVQLFVTHAASVFLLQVRNPQLLEEQVDICKRVLNIYRYMVMHTRMELKTWEQLLSVLLHITASVLSRTPPKKKDDTLGGKLAPAIFQTLIVTWIKANLNVIISTALWDQLLTVLTSLTQWEELIREWGKTLETLTRVLARHVYELDLTDLPLDRLTEQQAKKQRRGVKNSQVECGKIALLSRGSTKIMKASSNLLNDTTITDAGGSYPLCPTRKRTDSLGELAAQPSTYLRSLSDGNLSRTVFNGTNKPVPEYVTGTLIIAGTQRRDLSGLSSGNVYRKWRSLDSIRRNDSPVASRSPSPAPSSGVETSSIKDSPMPLDFVAGDSASLDCDDGDVGGRSVMGGGNVRGWFPDVAVVLWRRMLGALGDVNRLPDPGIHAQVFEYLVELWDTLAKIQANQGVPEEGYTPPPPILTPPLTLFASWCFKALELPDSYQKGKVSAYRLLCRIALVAGTWSLSSSHLALLYRSLHVGLAGPHPIIVYTLLKSLGPRFLSRQLPGYSLLLLDLISASNAVLESSDIQTAPRFEAASILGSVLSLPYMVSQAPSLDPRSPTLGVLNCAGAKDLVIASLLRCAKRELSGMARCTSISALATFAYTELSGPSPHPGVEYVFDVILLSLKFKQMPIGLVACDLLFALADHASSLFIKFPHLPPKILKALSSALGILGCHSGPLGPVLALTLGEWAMRFPVDLLLADKSSHSLLLNIFTVLSELSNGCKTVEVSSADFSEEICRDWENSIKVDDLKYPKKASDQSEGKHNLVLACRTVLMHLVNHLGHFPMGLGAARLSSLVQEHDDVPALGLELSPKLFAAQNVQFMLYRNSLMSMIEVEYLQAPGGGFTAGLVTAPSQARVIFRDLVNKASWDASALHCTYQDLPLCRRIPKFTFSACKTKAEDPPMSLLIHSTPLRCTIRHRPPHILPDLSNAAPDMDGLHDLLRYIGYTSAECLENPDLDLSEPGPSPPTLNKQIESEVISAILAQKTTENEYKQYSESIKCCTPPPPENSPAPFQQCLQFLSQLGLTGWERRSQMHLLAPSERLLRELRNLDTQRGRETHKVAVIYVAAGQEDKTSILSNKGGSQAYEQFVAGLAWEVELASHTGFSGGLNVGCGDTAPYYATPFVETLFHVSTRMPSDTEEALLQKMRHLGNDEVHVVWSEHNRDYRRSSLPTEFCDVLIVVYPLPDSLYRITIDIKSEMPIFGPLWNEAIVEGRALAGLVRATAIAASRAKRRTLSYYQTYYEERFTSLSGVIRNHRDSHSFEEFISCLYSPGLPTLGLRSCQPTAVKSLVDNYAKSATAIVENRTCDRVSPQAPKKSFFRSETESPTFPRLK